MRAAPSSPAGCSEIVLAARHISASLVGLLVDVVILRLAMRVGLEPAWARVVSLGCAMQITFVVNGIVVFRCLGSGGELLRQWATYIASSAVGNLCNYFVFVTLVSLHRPIVSLPMVAVCAGAACAWVINYTGARLIVFEKGLRQRAPGRDRSLRPVTVAVEVSKPDPL